MYLADILTYTDINSLSKIASEYNCQCNMHSKNELIQTILFNMGDNERLNYKFKQLDAYGKGIIYNFLFDQREYFSRDEIIIKIIQTLRWLNFNNIDNELKENNYFNIFKKYGWVFQGIKAEERNLFYIPNDIKRKLIAIIKNDLNFNFNDKISPDFYRDESELILFDLKVLVRYLLENEIVLTLDGVLHKRDQNQIMKLFIVKEKLINDKSWRFGYGKSFKFYPNRFSLIYDFSIYHKLIIEHPQKLEVSGYGKEFLNSNKEESLIDIYKFWLKLYKYAIPTLPIIVQIIDILSYDRWVSVEKLFSIIKNWIKEYYYDDVNSIFNIRIINMLFHLGIIKIGQNDKLLISMTEKGHQLINKVNGIREEAITFDT